MEATPSRTSSSSSAPPTAPADSKDITGRLRWHIEEARALVGTLEETRERRDLHDGLRTIASACSIVFKVRKLDSSEPPHNRLKAVHHHLNEIRTLAQGKLPERRQWIFQNGDALARQGLSLLFVRHPEPSVRR